MVDDAPKLVQLDLLRPYWCWTNQMQTGAMSHRGYANTIYAGLLSDKEFSQFDTLSAVRESEDLFVKNRVDEIKMESNRKCLSEVFMNHFYFFFRKIDGSRF